MSITPEPARQTPRGGGRHEAPEPQQGPQQQAWPQQGGPQPYGPGPRQGGPQQGWPQPYGPGPQQFAPGGYAPQAHGGPGSVHHGYQPHPPNTGGQVAPFGYDGLAQQRPIGLAMKRRNPVGVWLGLPLITFGIYTLVWYYKIHREMAEFDRRRVVPVAGPMLVLLFLSWTVVAPLVSLFNTGNRIAAVQRAAGVRPTCSAGLGLLLCFVFGLVHLYYQSELNKVVDAYGLREGTEITLRG